MTRQSKAKDSCCGPGKTRLLLLWWKRLRFHHQAQQQLASGLVFHQQTADEAEGNLLGGATEEGLGDDWEVRDGRGGYGSGLMRKC